MEKTKFHRQYPPLYEKAFPIILGILGVVLGVLLLVTLAIALRLLGVS